MIWANFLPSVFEMASVWHVMLLVFQRLLAIVKPVTYQTFHKKMRYISMTVIWTLSLILHLSKSLTETFDPKIGHTQHIFIALVFNLLPILSILFMEVILIWKLKEEKRKRMQRRTETHDATGNDLKVFENAMTKVVQRIVVVLIVCYGPFISWRIYFLFVSFDRKLSIVEVNLFLTLIMFLYLCLKFSVKKNIND